MSKILIINSDDWCRIYLDDKIISDNHSADLTDVLEKLKGKTLIDIKKIYFYDLPDCELFECPDDHFDEIVTKEKNKYYNL